MVELVYACSKPRPLEDVVLGSKTTVKPDILVDVVHACMHRGNTMVLDTKCKTYEKPGPPEDIVLGSKTTARLSEPSLGGPLAHLVPKGDSAYELWVQ